MNRTQRGKAAITAAAAPLVAALLCAAKLQFVSVQSIARRAGLRLFLVRKDTYQGLRPLCGLRSTCRTSLLRIAFSVVGGKQQIARLIDLALRVQRFLRKRVQIVLQMQV